MLRVSHIGGNIREREREREKINLDGLDGKKRHNDDIME